MAKKIGYIALTWFLVVFAYIILAAAMPAITGLATDTASTLSATSNMSNYPGTLEMVQTGPLWMWFIPGGVGLIATAVFLRQES